MAFHSGTNIPNHIVIIPDGNRRWAKEKRLPAYEGHRRGFEVAVKLTKACRNLGIHTLTLWAFSTENWQRSKEEVGYLMKLYEKMVDRLLKDAIGDQVRLVHLGRKDRIPKSLLAKIIKAETETKLFTRNILNIALDYGGRDEIKRAVNSAFKSIIRLLRFHSGQVHFAIAQCKRSGQEIKDPAFALQYRASAGKQKSKTKVEEQQLEITEEDIQNNLDTAGQPYPYPDLLIRTSGEIRSSGILMWQGVYTEYYFLKKYFPEMTEEDLKAAINEYSKRQRRFGK